MAKLKELKPKPPKILLYGPAGTGKTAFALTLGGQAQILDLEEGLKTGLHLNDQFKDERLEVDVKEFIDRDLRHPVAFHKLKNYVMSVANDCIKGKYPFRAIVLDSMTSLADAAINMVMANSGRSGGTPEIQHWGIIINEIDKVLTTLRSLPIVVVLIAHEQTKTIENQDKIEIAVPGKNLPSKITKQFDEVLYARVRKLGGGKRQYLLQTLSSDSITARSRSCLEDPTDMGQGMWKILERMGYKEAQDALKETEQPAQK